MSRRAQLRQLVERLQPTASIVTSRWYVPRKPPTVAERIAVSIEVSPRQSHVIQSVIGAGKTSELMKARQLVTTRAPDSVTAWIDPTVHSEVFADVQTGWIVDWAIHALAEELSARGRMSTLQDQGILEQLLVPPSERTPFTLPISREIVLRKLASALPNGATVFIDSVDRCENHSALVEALRADLPLLASIKIGVVLPLPPHLRVAEERVVAALHSAQQHSIAASDIADPDDRRWLGDVLRVRDSGALIRPSAIEKIIDASGGIARVLVQLACAAATTAVVVGADAVDELHVQDAINLHVENWLRSMTPQDLHALRAFAAHPNAVSLGERWWDHVAAGRILWSPHRSGVTASLHPLLATLLTEQAAA